MNGGSPDLGGSLLKQYCDAVEQERRAMRGALHPEDLALNDYDSAYVRWKLASERTKALALKLRAALTHSAPTQQHAG